MFKKILLWGKLNNEIILPNIKFNKLKDIKLPYENDGLTFHNICKNNTYIRVLSKDVSFFLQLLKRDNSWLLKPDKVSRTTDIAIMQKSLKVFTDEFCEDITHSNIKTSNKYKQTPKYLKNENFFLNFKSDKEIFIEVGFGSGRHLLHQAKNNPNVVVIGIEIHTPSIYQTLNKLDEENITNVFIVNFDARVLLEILPYHSVSKIFVHFPVPWDKKPHRRVYSNEFIQNATEVLRKDGTLELRSDSDNYFHYVFSLFNNLSLYDLQIFKNRDLEVSSKYEDRWKKMDKDIYDITFTNPTNIYDEQKKIENLKFDFEVDVKKVIQKFEKETVRIDDIYINFEHLVEFSNEEIAIKLSFGNGIKNEHLYLYIKDKEASYFPKKDILSIKSNQLAHKFLEEWLFS